MPNKQYTNPHSEYLHNTSQNNKTIIYCGIIYMRKSCAVLFSRVTHKVT